MKCTKDEVPKSSYKFDLMMNSQKLHFFWDRNFNKYMSIVVVDTSSKKF